MILRLKKRVVKSGNSLALTLEKPILKTLSLAEGDEVVLHIAKFQPVFYRVLKSFKEQKNKALITLLNKKKVQGLVLSLDENSVILFDEDKNKSESVGFTLIKSIEEVK